MSSSGGRLDFLSCIENIECFTRLKEEEKIVENFLMYCKLFQSVLSPFGV